MRILNEETELVSLENLRRHPKNPRQGDVESIQESISANGFYGALVVQRSTGYVLAGNHRMEAAKREKADKLPVIWVDVSDEEALRILLADNRTNDVADYDNSALAQLLKDLLSETGTLEGTGYDDDALSELLGELEDHADAGEDPGPELDRADELREKWGTEAGQLWEIPSRTSPDNSHRLLCGEATSSSDVGRLLDGAEPELMVTDPPYGVEYDASWRISALQDGHSGGTATGKVTNDDRADWREAWELFPGKVAYVWHAALATSVVGDSLEACGLIPRNLIVWAKSALVIGRGHYHHQHEACWYAVRKGASAGFVGNRKQTTLWRFLSDVVREGEEVFVRRKDAETLYAISGDESTIWDVPKPKKNETGHSTQKPTECMARPVRNHKGDVYDPFVGSGTTIVAAENQIRACFAMEIDPGYVAVILERLSGMGLEPRLLGRAKDAP